jgi:branched-chain amino acid transport system permease protein
MAIAGCLLADWAFRRSEIGKRLTETIEEGERHNPQRHQAAVYVALVISAAMAGLSGCLFAHFTGFISPFDFDIETSLFVLSVAAFGGLGYTPGVCLSAVGLGWLLEHFRNLLPYRFWFAGMVFLLASLGWPWWPQRRPRFTSAQPQDAEAK